jgi:peptidoglycan/LPS O-acetylase OafA/YrhL
MIQRIQTVWLFLLALLSAVWTTYFTTDEALIASVVKIGSALVAVGALIAIFLYKKRKNQLKVCYGLLVAVLALCVLLFAKHVIFGGLLYTGGLLLVILAILAIRKDEKLVRSLDRLR